MESFLRIIDLGEAAVLMTLGYRLSGLEKSKRGNHKIFLFVPLEGSSPASVIQDYKNHELKIDPYQFFLNQKELKSRIHSMDESI